MKIKVLKKKSPRCGRGRSDGNKRKYHGGVVSGLFFVEGGGKDGGKAVFFFGRKKNAPDREKGTF